MEYTPVHNRFWADGWVRELNALDRYLFLYLLTNGRAKLTGIYELPIDLMASESGIDSKDLRLSMLQRLEPKIYYREGWVIIINYDKHSVNKSRDYKLGVSRVFAEIPSKIREIAISYGYPSIDPPPTLPTRWRDTRIEEKRIDTPSSNKLLQDIKEVKVNEEGEEKPKYKRKYPHSKEVFALFSRPQRSWEINTTELKHAELLYERGIQTVKNALAYVMENRDDPYLPEIVKPSDLERKWLELNRHKAKHL
jgi:hypothetical protein